MGERYCVVLMTAPDEAAAEKLAAGLVEGRLAACVNRVGKVSSVYRWEEKVQSAEEFLLLAKSRRALVPEVVEYVRKNHPHAVPEVVSVDIESGFAGYLDWIGANTRFTKLKQRPASRGE